jgi:hypothetical protein
VGERWVHTLRTGSNESSPSSNLAPSKINFPNTHCRQFQCLRGLKRGSAVFRLLGLRVRIPQGAWMSVGVVCCQVEVSATGWSLVQRSPTECGLSECDRVASTMRRPWPSTGCHNTGNVPMVYFAPSPQCYQPSYADGWVIAKDRTGRRRIGRKCHDHLTVTLRYLLADKSHIRALRHTL